MPLAHRDEGDEIGRNVTVLKKYLDQGRKGQFAAVLLDNVLLLLFVL
jgi:hypothetical protein